MPLRATSHGLLTTTRIHQGCPERRQLRVCGRPARTHQKSRPTCGGQALPRNELDCTEDRFTPLPRSVHSAVRCRRCVLADPFIKAMPAKSHPGTPSGPDLIDKCHDAGRGTRGGLPVRTPRTAELVKVPASRGSPAGRSSRPPRVAASPRPHYERTDLPGTGRSAAWRSQEQPSRSGCTAIHPLPVLRLYSGCSLRAAGDQN